MNVFPQFLDGLGPDGFLVGGQPLGELNLRLLERRHDRFRLTWRQQGSGRSLASAPLFTRFRRCLVTSETVAVVPACTGRGR